MCSGYLETSGMSTIPQEGEVLRSPEVQWVSGISGFLGKKEFQPWQQVGTMWSLGSCCDYLFFMLMTSCLSCDEGDNTISDDDELSIIFPFIQHFCEGL